MAVSFIRGLQGDDPKYIKAMACAKHFAVHSGPEPERHRFNVQPSEQDLYTSYLPQFEAAVREGQVGIVMGAYNRVDGEPACSNPFLLTELLRKRWDFDGHVVSDCGAIYDIYANHMMVPNSEEAAARAVKAGCDLCCGADYNSLTRAVLKKLISTEEIDVALTHVLTTRFRLGMFDRPAQVAYTRIPLSQNDSAEHEALALRVARESMVLLKNDGLLPLRREKLKRITVIGPNADSVAVLQGNYFGVPARPVTILAGIKKAAGRDIEVRHALGCRLASRQYGSDDGDFETLAEAVQLAKWADVVIYAGGLSAALEGEEMPVNYDGFASGDRTRIEMPDVQTRLLQALFTTGKPLVFVNCSGSAIAMPWEVAHLRAIVQAWYPGEQGGRAVADVLFGDANPGGRLPVTFYASTVDLPAFDDYSMSNRTYRYFTGKPEFAFGHGLSYTRFEYRDAKLSSTNSEPGGTLKLSFELRNAGTRDGEEVAQIYFRKKTAGLSPARLALCGFARMSLVSKQTAHIKLEVPSERFRAWSVAEKRYVIEPGAYELLVGAASDDIRCRAPFEVTQGKGEK
jgi:beta-glucosidase